MKRLLTCLLVLCLALSLCACGDSPAEPAPSQTEPAKTTAAQTAPAETEAVKTEPAETEPAETEPAETEPAETEPAETEPAETEPAETEPAMTSPEGERVRDDDLLLEPFLGLWCWGVPDGYYYICADWTWVYMDANGAEMGHGPCAYIENYGLVLEREDGTDQDYLNFGLNGALYQHASAPLRRADFPVGPADLSSYPYEDPEFPAFSEQAWKISEELYPKVLALEDFFYDAASYGYEYMDDMMRAYSIIRWVHPETRNYFILEEVFDGDDFVGLQSKYGCFYDPEGSEDKGEIRAAITAFEERADEIVAGLTEDMTAYEKYFYLAIAISQNADYDYDHESGMPNAPWAGIMGGKFICEGYSVAMQYLCQKANLYCKCVEGYSRGESHGWNLVKLPTGTYYVDITWADGSGKPGDPYWQQYFILTQEQILYDHEITDGTVATGE